MDIGKAISAALALPPEAVLDIPKITIIGRERVHVENYISLIEYKREIVELKYSAGVIEISGENFEIRTIGEANIVISGKISGIRFI